MRTMQDMFILVSVFAILLVLAASYFWQPVLWAYLLITPVVLLGIYDIWQKNRTILRLYPVIGHLRYVFESIRPEIQQYFVENDTNGMPVSREFRSLVYQRAKGQSDTRPFGTTFDTNRVGYEWTNHSMFPAPMMADEPRVIFGENRARQPYCSSLVNISALSFGALSPNALRALNMGAKLGNFAHNTGEGGISSYHLENGGDLIWQIGTGYFGCRTLDGHFSRELFAKNAAHEAVKMIEVKLSQGAKPGHGGLLPAAKVTAEIAQIRGVEIGKDVVSPPDHSAFRNPIELLEFIEDLRQISGKPVGFKLAVGRPQEFLAICKAMLTTNILPDFITVDGGEGGTGASPIEFSNSMGTPLREALHLVHSCLVGCGLREQIRVAASGKLFSAFHLYRSLAMGADCINSGRGMMFALGCIQSLNCNNDKCPTGITTQNLKRSKALDVTNKSQRVANYQSSLVFHFRKIMVAAGLNNTQDISAHDIFRRISETQVKSLADIYPVMRKGALLNESSVPEDWRYYWQSANPECWSKQQQKQQANPSKKV